MKKLSKVKMFLVVGLLMSLVLGGCSNDQSFDSSKAIGVISREDGSGTRGAFVELLGIEQKNSAGEKVDYTTTAAVITNSTSVMITTVSMDLYSIGYISLGSLNNSVKALAIDGAAASVENIKNGSYKIARPFNIATNENLSALGQDFINFIMSSDGQKVIEDNGYIAITDGESYSSSGQSGKLVIGGSSSVAPVMEKLKEAYLVLNPNVTLEVQQSDSSTGMSNTADGIYEIGMASRELKQSELDNGLQPTVMAMDGIAVIVNNANEFDGLTSEQVKDIFMGNIKAWQELSN